MDKYKYKSLNFRGCAESRMLRVIKKNSERRSIRCDEIHKRRNIKMTDSVILEESQNIENSVGQAEIKKMDSRKQQLMKWKEEKALLKKLEAIKRKPVFKVAHVTHDKTPRLVSKEVDASKHKVVQKEVKQKSVPSLSRPMTRSMASSQKISQNEPSKANKKVEKANACKTKEKKIDAPKEKPLVQELPEDKKSFAPENFQFFVPGNLVNFNWEPTPLTPRTSRQFVFSDSDGSGPPTGRNSSTPKYDQKDNVSEVFDGISLSTINHPNLSSFITERPKVLRTPVKVNSPILEADAKQEENTTQDDNSEKFSTEKDSKIVDEMPEVPKIQTNINTPVLRSSVVKSRTEANNSKDECRETKKKCSPKGNSQIHSVATPKILHTPKNSLQLNTRLRSSVSKNGALPETHKSEKVSEKSTPEDNSQIITNQSKQVPNDFKTQLESETPETDDLDVLKENRTSNEATTTENSNFLCSKYFEKSTMLGNISSPSVKDGIFKSYENTPLRSTFLDESAAKEESLLNFNTPILKSSENISELLNDHLKISEDASKLESVPQRVLRSNKQRMSLLYSPMPKPSSKCLDSVTSDLMSFSPATK